MTSKYGFILLQEREIPEIRSKARLYRHERTKAEVLSLENEDTNKVFGISFRTPPHDSTGVAHILEHSVLCGSRKYPVKEPFVELLKGSLQTFLNAMTYPDKTCYPVASQNLQDFYNLIDVYMDAVFHPIIEPRIFEQEGWHVELDDPKGKPSFKGVVFNEMKGAYSSPDNLISEYSQQSLFPETLYRYDSGGHPEIIPELTYEDFMDFHRTFYHPSNARIFFYGDDDPDKRLKLLSEYLEGYDSLQVDSSIPLQPLFSEPRHVEKGYIVGKKEEDARGMVTVNWLMDTTEDVERNLAFHILDYILVGMPASPLRKILIDSGLGEDLVGGGLEDELKQMFFSTGLKGVRTKDLPKIEPLVLQGLSEIVAQGISRKNMDAAVNTVEFRLREQNTGMYPRGLLVMLRALSVWLYGGDPFSLLSFEKPLQRIKERINKGETVFEDIIRQYFLKNPHRTTVILKPDHGLAAEVEQREQELLERKTSTWTEEDKKKACEHTRELRAFQEAPDSPEALATIPQLKVEDLQRENEVIPTRSLEEEEYLFLHHDIPTNSITYVDLAFDLSPLNLEQLSLVPLLGRSLLEMGTDREDYVALTQRIQSETGGIFIDTFASQSLRDHVNARLIFRGKAIEDKTDKLLALFKDILLTVNLNDRQRFKQILLEEKAARERQVIPAGHRYVDIRLRSGFTLPDYAEESMSGVLYLKRLRELIKEVENNWEKVLEELTDIRTRIITRSGCLCNVTLEESAMENQEQRFRDFLQDLPEGTYPMQNWVFLSEEKGLGLIIPAQINYVGKGIDLYGSGYRFHGSMMVISRYLRNSWLWEQIRVKGGAYGAFCNFDRMTGVMTFVSYRDPNVIHTVETFQNAGIFLRKTPLGDEELNKAIVGAIGSLDHYQLPDAKGYTAMLRYLNHDTDELRQIMREEILSTSRENIDNLAEHLEKLLPKGRVIVMGAEEQIEHAMKDGVGISEVFQVL